MSKVSRRDRVAAGRGIMKSLMLGTFFSDWESGVMLSELWADGGRFSWNAQTYRDRGVIYLRRGGLGESTGFFMLMRGWCI